MVKLHQKKEILILCYMLVEMKKRNGCWLSIKKQEISVRFDWSDILSRKQFPYLTQSFLTDSVLNFIRFLRDLIHSEPSIIFTGKKKWISDIRQLFQHQNLRFNIFFIQNHPHQMFVTCVLQARTSFIISRIKSPVRYTAFISRTHTSLEANARRFFGGKNFL